MEAETGVMWPRAQGLLSLQRLGEVGRTPARASGGAEPTDTGFRTPGLQTMTE